MRPWVESSVKANNLDLKSEAEISFEVRTCDGRGSGARKARDAREARKAKPAGRRSVMGGLRMDQVRACFLYEDDNSGTLENGEVRCPRSETASTLASSDLGHRTSQLLL